MRLVKLITGVTVEEVPCSGTHLEGYTQNSSPSYSTNELLHTSSYHRYVVPVKEWITSRCCGKTGSATLCLAEACKDWENNVDYIAMSPEVDETIGKYIKIISNELAVKEEERAFYMQQFLNHKEALSKLTNKVVTASFWKRLKYLFTGDLTSLVGDGDE